MKNMKRLHIALTLFFALAIPLYAWGSTTEWAFDSPFWSNDTGTAIGTTTSDTYAAVGGTIARTGKIPVVDFYSVTADNAANRLDVLSENGDGTTLSAAHVNGTTVAHVNGTTGLAVDAYIAIQSASAFEVNKIDSITSATVIVLERATTSAYPSGAKLRELSALYSVPVGAATVTTPARLAGKRGKIMGWHLNGSAACRINNVTGHYE